MKDSAVKIDDSIKKTAGLGVGSTQNRSGKVADKSGPAGTAATPSDSVHISSQQQYAGDGSFDVNKVDEIKAAIAGGQFQVNPEKVANGLMATVQDLIQTSKA